MFFKSYSVLFSKFGAIPFHETFGMFFKSYSVLLSKFGAIPFQEYVS